MRLNILCTEVLLKILTLNIGLGLVGIMTIKAHAALANRVDEIGRASCRERV